MTATEKITIEEAKRMLKEDGAWMTEYSETRWPDEPIRTSITNPKTMAVYRVDADMRPVAKTK